MKTELIYLPVSRDERALLRWLRTSSFADDPTGLIEALRRADAAGVSAAALDGLIAGAPTGGGEDRTLDDLIEQWRAFRVQTELDAARIANIDARMRHLEGAAPPEAAAPLPPDPMPSRPIGDGARIAVMFDGHLVHGKRVKEFMQKLAELLVTEGWAEPSRLPIRSGRKRYIAHSEPVHPTGRRFHTDVSHQGLHIEAHGSFRDTARKVEKIAAALDINCEVVHLELRSRGQSAAG